MTETMTMDNIIDLTMDDNSTGVLVDAVKLHALIERLRTAERQLDYANTAINQMIEVKHVLAMKLAAAEAERDLARAAEDTSSIVRQSIEAQVRSLTADLSLLRPAAERATGAIEEVARLTLVNGRQREQVEQLSARLAEKVTPSGALN